VKRHSDPCGWMPFSRYGAEEGEEMLIVSVWVWGCCLRSEELFGHSNPHIILRVSDLFEIWVGRLIVTVNATTRVHASVPVLSRLVHAHCHSRQAHQQTRGLALAFNLEGTSNSISGSRTDCWGACCGRGACCALATSDTCVGFLGFLGFKDAHALPQHGAVGVVRAVHWPLVMHWVSQSSKMLTCITRGPSTAGTP
jgi:hypothetical protein